MDIDLIICGHIPRYFLNKVICPTCVFIQKKQSVMRLRNYFQKISTSLKAKVKKNFSSHIEMENKKLDVMNDYAISGMITVYQSWFNSDRSQSIEEIS